MPSRCLYVLAPTYRDGPLLSPCVVFLHYIASGSICRTQGILQTNPSASQITRTHCPADASTDHFLHLKYVPKTTPDYGGMEQLSGALIRKRASPLSLDGHRYHHECRVVPERSPLVTAMECGHDGTIHVHYLMWFPQLLGSRSFYARLSIVRA